MGLNSKDLKKLMPKSELKYKTNFMESNIHVADEILTNAPKYHKGNWKNQFWLIHHFTSFMVAFSFLFNKITQKIIK